MNPPEYFDPENKDLKDSIRDSLHTYRRNGKELLRIATTFFHDWIQDEITEPHSKELKRFEENWHFICRQVRSEPKSLLLVKHVCLTPNDDRKSLLILLCDYLTQCGYLVRTQGEFQRCNLCGKIICSERYHQILEGALKRKFDGMCLDCSQSSNHCSSKV